MVKKPKDPEQMRSEMGKLIEALELPELNKQFLRARWLEQVIWMDEKAWESVRWSRRSSGWCWPNQRPNLRSPRSTCLPRKASS
ncbi:MAG: hypothetical protein P0120_10485 [Nitrospira sp.]|nr:hypothetical protein [Nitrospira sp.]